MTSQPTTLLTLEQLAGALEDVAEFGWALLRTREQAEQVAGAVQVAEPVRVEVRELPGGAWLVRLVER